MAVDEVVIRAILKDELSRGLEGIRQKVERLDKQMVSSQRATTSMSRGLNGLHLDLGRATSSVNRMSMSLAQFSGRQMQHATLGLVGLGTAAVGFGLKSAASFQSSQIAFGTLLGSVEAGNALFAQLQKFNLQTPFGLQDISSATQTLLQFGFTADNVMGTLKGISDTAALTDNPGENLSRIAVALGQIKGAGVLRAQDLNQLVQAGFPAYQLLQDITGRTAMSIRKQMENGLDLPAEKFIAAVQSQQGVLAKYAGGAAAQAKTLRGIWSNFMDMLRIRLATAMQPLADSLQSMLPKFSDSLGLFIDKAVPALSRIGIELLDMLTKALPVLEPLVTQVLTSVGDILTSPVMGQIGTALTSFVYDFVPHIPEFINAFLQLALILPPLVDILTRLLPVVTPVTAGVAGAASALPDPKSHHGLGYYAGLATAPAGMAMNALTGVVKAGYGAVTGGAPTPAGWIHDRIYGKSETNVTNIHPGAVVVNNPTSNVQVSDAVEQAIARERAKRQRRG